MREGMRGCIEKVGESGGLRLLEMGLLPGEQVRIIRRAPLGDPFEIEVKGYRLSIRKTEGREVEVEVAG